MAATVVNLRKTTGCGLALHLADSSYVVSTGATWANFHATAGEHVLVGYATERRGALRQQKVRRARQLLGWPAGGARLHQREPNGYHDHG